jgi:hypothetical protein
MFAPSITPRAWRMLRTSLSTKTTIVEFTTLLLCTKLVVTKPVRRLLPFVKVNRVKKARRRKPRILLRVSPSSLRPSKKMVIPRVKFMTNKKILIRDPMRIFFLLEFA